MRDGVSLSGPGMGVAVHFAGSKPGNLDGLDREAGVVNYLLGPDPAHWRRNVPTFARVRRLNMYPGIDAVFYGSDGELEYDLIAAPGADASKIVLEFTGAHNLRLNDHGEIALETAGGTLIQQLPSVYQDAPRGRIQLHTRYRVINASAVALIVPSYDHRLPLTIDPALVYSAQIGGHTGNQVNGMTVDSAGNTYLTGSTSAVDFPVVNALESQLAAGSFYRFDNGGASTVRLDSTNAALYTLTADPTNPGTVYAGTLNGILKSTDAGAHWTAGTGLPSGVLSEPIVIDPSNTQVLYTSSYGIYQSLDGGATWNALTNGLPPAVTQPPYYSGPSSFFVDPFHPSRVFLNTPSGPFLSTNRGTSWNTYPFLFGILAFDPSTDGTVYRYYQNLLYKSTDGGNTWAYLSFLAGFSVSLVVDPFQPSTLYATTSSGVFRSTDLALTWQLDSPANLSLNSLIADPTSSGTLYGNAGSQGIYKTPDGGATWTRITPAGLTVKTLALGPGPSGSSPSSSLYAATQSSTNAFVTKLDPKGNIVYSTYIGGSITDSGTAITLDSQGNIYVTGIATSPDFPLTPGALRPPNSSNGGFVLKLDPKGDEPLYSSIVAGAQPGAIAIDSSGAAYITGSSQGGIPVTPGAYWTQPPMFISTGFFGIPQADTFVAKLNPAGSALIYATYLNQLFLPGGSGACDFANDQTGRGITIDPSGNAYLANAVSPALNKLSADGSLLLATIKLPSKARAVTLDPSGNIFITGNNALVEKLDPTGAVLFSTELGGSTDIGRAIALDSQGNIVVAGNTCSSVFPTRAPLQGSFGPQTAFLSKLDPSAKLLFSTYVGSVSAFQISGMGLDPNDQAIIAGSTFLTQGNSLGSEVYLSKYDMSNVPPVRLDDVRNAASQRGIALSPGEIINVDGAGFTASGTQLLFDGNPATVLSATATQVVATVPYALLGKTITQVQVQSGGQTSNPVWYPVAPTSPGIYTADGSGSGLALAFNQDGTQNSPSNPAPTGSTVTFFATGVGQTTPPGVDGVLHRTGAAFPLYPVYTFLNNFFVPVGTANVGQYPGFPADVAVVQIQIPGNLYAAPTSPLLNITANGQKSQEENYPSSNSPTVFIAIKP